MKSYPIWNEVESCLYKSKKSYGAVDHTECKIKVGSSASNSRDLAEVSTTKTVLETEIWFTLKVDGVKVKRAVFENVSGRAGDHIETVKYI